MIIDTNITRCYLKTIGRHKLLSPIEEIELSRLISKYLSIQKARLKLSRDYQLEEKEVSWSLISQYLNKSISCLQKEYEEGFKARQTMIESNLRLVVSIAKNYRNRGLPFQDLIQEGIIGLINGVERFDDSFGCRVSTYISWWLNRYCYTIN